MPLRLFCKTFASLVVVLALLVSGPASAQQSISLIRDTEVENIIRGYATPIFVAAGLDPTNVRIYIVNDRQINAFVAGGQNLFINSGLLMQSTDANQVIGVIAHEAGHIAGGHLSRVHEALARGTAENILSMVLGAAAALAGRPDIGMAVMSGGQNVALRNFLQYSRTQESAADAAGMSFLDATQTSARGLATFMYWVDDRWILDPIINGIGRVTVWIARFAADFDRYVVDGTVGGFAWLASRTGSVLHNAQNGQVQVYLMVLVVSVTIWLLLTALPMILTLV